MIKNPVLNGFHPDPSMIQVNGTFYVANSTFEYFPGVRISASKDLANWECVSTPLTDDRHLNMRGNIMSGGIWAPCLSYSDGIFYLVYTDVKTWKKYPFKDAHNFIITAKNIEGPWTEPIYMNTIGFDTSLFHDGGKKYFLNAEWDYRKQGDETFSGILVTEVDPITLEFIGETRKIFSGTDRGLLEAPHLYKKDGWYYLITAEGGTYYNHASTVARSRDIFGPYELHPNKYICSAKGHPEHPIQKTGHASWCQGQDGRWFLAFLCARPANEKHCILGRETGINELIWKNDWPYLKNETLLVDEYFEGYGEKTIEKEYREYSFGNKEFHLNFNTLRGPTKYKLGPNNTLRLYGAESPFSNHNQSVFVRRQTDFNFEVTTHMTLPFHQFQQFAGLIYRYDEGQQYLLKMAFNERIGKQCLGVMAFRGGNYNNPLGDNEIPIDGDDVWLRVTGTGVTAKFSYSLDGNVFTEIDYSIDTTTLSDDYCFGFTGAYIGIAAYDLFNRTGYADFTHFSYRVL
jgi:xylan 1,4-beta-xylosidase